MNIGIDVDNTISAYPEFFAAFTKAMRAQGHKIYILTSIFEDYRERREEELKEWNIEYDELVCTQEFKKKKYAEDRDIDFVFDDICEEYDRMFSNVPFRFIRLK